MTKRVKCISKIYNLKLSFVNNQISQAVTSSGQNLSHLVLVVFLLVRAPLGLPDVKVIVKD